jgi:cell division protein YceG involved in septum cleavage
MKESNRFNQKRHTALWFIKPAFYLLLALFLTGSMFLTACSTQWNPTTSNNTQTNSATSNSTPTNPTTASSTTVTTTPPAETATVKAVIGVIKVQGGAMLERDIIPQLCQVFSMSEPDVKNKLAAASSSTLINAGLTNFRRMEGIILPGEYEIVDGSTLEERVSDWVAASEKRYNKLLTSNINLNNLKPAEQLSLASMVEAECLSSTHQEEVATVFLNRLEDGSKLQSCVTAEYALGYQRPYLTGDDVTKASEYNTYYVSGLPVGPICAISDASLKASMSKKMNSDIYFFYYDYILNDMFFFDDYSRFKKEGSVSRQCFVAKSPVDKRAKINKQDLYH